MQNHFKFLNGMLKTKKKVNHSFYKSNKISTSKPKNRHLALETLEERALLAVTAAEYVEISGLYSNLQFPEDQNLVNIIELTDLTQETIQGAIDQAISTAGDDLIVLRMGEESALHFSEKLTIEAATSDPGALNIVGIDGEGRILAFSEIFVKGDYSVGGGMTFNGDYYYGIPKTDYDFQPTDDLLPQMTESKPLIHWDEYRNDSRFSSLTGSGYSTVIIDTGINASHEEFAGRIVYQWDFADNDADATDVNGHGTHVAGITAGSTYGIAQDVNIIVLKVFSDEGGGAWSYDIQDALQWVIENTEAYNIVSVNMSLGSTSAYRARTESYYHNELETLAQQGVTVCIAAGNDYDDFCVNSDDPLGVSSPSCDPYCISVGATCDGSYTFYNSYAYASGSCQANDLAYFSQRDPLTLDIAAPGMKITSAGINSSTASALKSGTSMATPIITGAVVLAQNVAHEYLGHSLSVEEIRTLLRNTATVCYDAETDDTVTNMESYYYLVDIYALADAIYQMGQTQKADLAVGVESGWNSGIVVAASSTALVSSPYLTTLDDIYVNFSVLNQSLFDVTQSFKATITLSGAASKTMSWTFDSLSAMSFANTLDNSWSLGKLAAGAYTLTLTLDTANTVNESNESNNVYTKSFTVIAQIVADRYETNNTFDTAANLGTISETQTFSNLSIHDASDVDYYEFTLTAAGTSSDYVKALFTHADGNLEMKLYDASQSLIKSSCSSSDNEEISLSGLAAGTYYLYIYGNRSAVNAYSLEFSFSVEITSVTLSTNTPKVGDTITATLTPSSATANYQWYRVNSSGTAAAISGATGSCYTVTSTDLGYYLKVTVEGTGNYTGTLNAKTSSSVEETSTSLVVTTYTDVVDDTDGVLSLREAITKAADGDKITFASFLKGKTITLAGTLLSISKGITIDASSIGGITIDANQASRVFSVSGGTEANPVQLIGLTIQNGKVSGYGGGIYNSGTLTLTNCTVLGNSVTAVAGPDTGYGGGIYNSSTITLTNCTVSGNSASNFGGGIYNYKGTVTLKNSIVSVNYASFSGSNISGTYTSSYSYVNAFDPGFVCAPVFNNSGVLTNADLHLKSSSWLINAGDNSAVSVEGDLEGNPRIYDGVVDLGAYEYQQSPSEREAVSLIVTTEEDSWLSDGKTSLREAIYNAQTGDKITFASSLKGKTITLAGIQLEISKGITIDASSIGGITINANQKSRIFSVSGGTEANPVQLIGLTIQNGKVSRSYKECGGGIYNSGALTLTNCTVSGNSATESSSYGGGIYNSSGALTLTNCAVSGNSATESSSYGGGIYNSSGTVTLTNCTVSGNSAKNCGGGICNGYYGNNNSGTITLTNCTVSGNSAKYGSGIYNSSGTVTLMNSIVSVNYSSNISGTYTSSYSYIRNFDPGFVCVPVFNNSGVLTNAETLDLHLKFSSWLINSGDNSAVSVEGDLEGNSRIYGGVVDLGAYEYQQSISEREAVSLIVTTEEDSFDGSDGKTSLREAIYNAQAGETITFTASLAGKIITLCGEELILDKGITIDATSIGGITIDANQKNRVFYVSGGTEANPVQLIGLTIQNGKTTGNGGGIYNFSGVLTLTNCTVSGNSASSDGGGICNYNSSGTVTLTNSTVSGNSAGCGGGIYNYGIVTLTNCIVSGNSAGSGGGIDNSSGTVTLTNCTVSGNSAKYCGGISGSSNKVTLKNSIVSVNYASYHDSNLYGTYIPSCSYISFIDPGFVCAPIFDDSGVLTNAAALDLHLKSSSWLINSGDNSAVSIEDDLEGNPRIYGGIVDLGAYEYQQSPSKREAVSLVVTTEEDSFDSTDGKTSLREAIYNAQTGKTITFAASLAGKVITLCGEEFILNKGITIDATSIGGMTIDANQKSRVFYVNGGTEADPVQLIGLTIQNGKSSDPIYGGGIYNYKGALILTNCAVSGNSTEYYGGGIYNNSGTVTLMNCTVSGNSAGLNGGGIYNSGTLTLTNCTVTGNSAGYGGGIYNSGTVTLTNCTVSGNSATSHSYASGGGICNSNSSGTVTLTNSIVSVNYDYDSSCNSNISGTYMSSYSYINGIDPGFVCTPIFNDSGVLTNAETLDLHLKSSSWLINTGDNSAVSVEDDLEGNPRIYGGVVDLGAYEYQQSPSKREAVSLVVTTEEDSFDSTDGKTSLREAIYNAQTGETITFAASLAGKIITLCGVELTVDKGITIDATSIGGMTIDANQKSRAFYVSGGTKANPVQLIGLTIQNGKVLGYGGGIYNFGTVTLTNCAVLGNSANYGGGIYNYKGTFTLTNCAVSGNSADYGGGICNYGTFTLTNCAVSGNSATYYGGGIYNADYNNNYGTVTLTNCTVSGNSVKVTNSYSFAYGGGIYNNSGTVTLTNSIVSVNYASSSDSNINGIYVSSYSYISDLDPGFVCAPIFDDSGVLTNAETLDLHLKSSSWLINTGDNGAISIEDDLEGNPRIYGGVVDLGAYEYQQSISEREAVSLIVTTEEDSFDPFDSKTSLREAIYHAQTGETITFAASLAGKIITLCGVELTIDKGITIDATSIGRIIIDANQASRVFYVVGGTDANPVQLIALTILNGKVSSSGGGIYNYKGVLTLTNCAISGNSANYGGGIYNYKGVLTLTNCAVSGNSASSGGGIDNDGIVMLMNCAVLENSANYGGGIYNHGTFTLTNGTVSENSVTKYGGGIINYGTLTLTNCTMSGNSATSSSSSTYGGGIYNDYSGTVTLTNCTMTGNSATSSGGGIYNHYSGTLNSYNSIIALNTASSSGSDIYNYDSSGTINGYNTLSSWTSWDAGSGNLEYDSSKPLFTDAGNGDYTLCKGSQAIDKGNNTYVTASVDLARKKRIVGAAVDLGAYEYTTISQLAQPIILTLSTSETKVNISWDKINNANQYKLEYSEDETFTDDDLIYTKTVSVTNATITGLSPKKTYYFRVAAKDTSKTYLESEYSDIKSIYISIPQLDQPKNLTLTIDGKSVNAAWSAVNNADRYILEYSEDQTFTDEDLIYMKTVTATNVTISGLTIGKTYYFRVMAKDTTGIYTASAYSTVKSIYIPKPQLTQPQNLTLTVNGTSVKAVWDVVENANRYILEYSEDQTFTDEDLIYTKTVSAANVTISGLTVGKTYYFRVMAKDTTETYATSIYSETKSILIPIPQLSAPSNLTLTVNGTSVTASWNAVENANKYMVEYAEDRSFSDYTSKRTSATSLTFSGLAPEKYVYYFRVMAMDTTGVYPESDYSEIVSTDAKTSLTGIKLSTNAPNVGDTITATVAPSGATANYQWYRVNTSGKETAITNATAKTYTVTSSDVGYYLKVTATGTGNYTGTVHAKTTSTVPSELISLTGIKLSTTAPNVGDTITATVAPSGATANYQWFRVNTSGKETAITNATAQTYTVTSSDVGYYLKVTATGTGNYTGTVQAKTDVIAKPEPEPDKLDTPSNVALSTDGANVTVTWDAVANADRYLVYYGADPENMESSSFVVSTTTRKIISGLDLTKGTYYFSVQARDSSKTYSNSDLSAPARLFTVSITNNKDSLVSGALLTATVYPKMQGITYQWYRVSESGDETRVAGKTSNRYKVTEADKGFALKVVATAGTDKTSAVTVTVVPLSTPSVALLKRKGTSVAVNWHTIPGADTYDVYYSSNASFATYEKITTSDYYTQVNNLTLGETYYFKIQAIDSTGTYVTSAESAVKSVKLDKLGIPEITNIKASGSTITLDWTLVTGADRYVINYAMNADFSGYKSKIINSTTTNSATLTGLTMGNIYHVRIQARNSANTYTTSEYSIRKITVNKLAAPVISSLSQSGTSLTVKWSAVENANRYVIYYSTSSTFASANTKTKVVNDALTGTISGLTKGNTYYVKIQARDTAGKFTTSDDSAVRSIAVSAALPQMDLFDDDDVFDFLDDEILEAFAEEENFSEIF